MDSSWTVFAVTLSLGGRLKMDAGQSGCGD
jgi:hypothetical protein